MWNTITIRRANRWTIWRCGVQDQRRREKLARLIVNLTAEDVGKMRSLMPLNDAGKDCWAEVHSGHSPGSTARSIVDVVDARGEVDGRIFENLLGISPGREAAIRAVQRGWAALVLVLVQEQPAHDEVVKRLLTLFAPIMQASAASNYHVIVTKMPRIESSYGFVSYLRGQIACVQPRVLQVVGDLSSFTPGASNPPGKAPRDWELALQGSHPKDIRYFLLNSLYARHGAAAAHKFIRWAIAIELSIQEEMASEFLSAFYRWLVAAEPSGATLPMHFPEEFEKIKASSGSGDHGRIALNPEAPLGFALVPQAGAPQPQLLAERAPLRFPVGGILPVPVELRPQVAQRPDDRVNPGTALSWCVMGLVVAATVAWVWLLRGNGPR